MSRTTFSTTKPERSLALPRSISAMIFSTNVMAHWNDGALILPRSWSTPQATARTLSGGSPSAEINKRSIANSSRIVMEIQISSERRVANR